MMRLAIVLSVLACAASPAQASQADTNPISKVIEMLSELQQKIIGEGQVAQKIFDEFTEWCEEESKNLGFEIKTAKAEVAELQATIEKMISDIGAKDELIE